MANTAEGFFNNFYEEYKKHDESNNSLIFNFLPRFLTEIKNLWGYRKEEFDVSVNAIGVSDIEGSRVLFLKHLNYGLNFLAFCDDGNVYDIKCEYTDAGSITWNGDDEYFSNMKIITTSCSRVDFSVNLSELSKNCVITSDKMESSACEIISIAYNYE